MSHLPQKDSRETLQDGMKTQTGLVLTRHVNETITPSVWCCFVQVNQTLLCDDRSGRSEHRPFRGSGLGPRAVRLWFVIRPRSDQRQGLFCRFELNGSRRLVLTASPTWLTSYAALTETTL